MTTTDIATAIWFAAGLIALACILRFARTCDQRVQQMVDTALADERLSHLDRRITLGDLRALHHERLEAALDSWEA